MRCSETRPDCRIAPRPRTPSSEIRSSASSNAAKLHAPAVMDEPIGAERPGRAAAPPGEVETLNGLPAGAIIGRSGLLERQAASRIGSPEGRFPASTAMRVTRRRKPAASSARAAAVIRARLSPFRILSQ